MKLRTCIEMLALQMVAPPPPPHHHHHHHHHHHLDAANPYNMDLNPHLQGQASGF
jgi:hypothetical protein